MFKNKHCRMQLRIAVMVFWLAVPASAKIRWSSLQHIPSADLIPSGRFVADAHLFWTLDTFSFSRPSSVQRLEIGLSEWVNCEIGYAEGFSMGFKAGILRDSGKFIPAISIGARNLFSHRENYYYSVDNSDPENEFFIAIAKNVNPLVMRVHLGVLTVPASKKNRNDLFFGLERYFGGGFYMSFEGMMRSGQFAASLFTSWRTIKDRLEFNVGVIDLERAFSAGGASFLKPGIRTGMRVSLGKGLNTMDGLYGLEDRIDRQNDTLARLKRQLDTLRHEVRWNSEQISAQKGFPEEYMEQRKIVLDELTKLKNFYDQEPFDPKVIKSTVELMVGQRDLYAPHLRIMVTDPQIERGIRALAVTVLGEIGDQNAADVLLGLLGRTVDPAIRIEAMIALGKMKEVRAGYMLKELMNDPDSAVSFTASEILKKLENQTGADFIAPQPSSTPEPSPTVPEQSIMPDFQ